MSTDNNSRSGKGLKATLLVLALFIIAGVAYSLSRSSRTDNPAATDTPSPGSPSSAQSTPAASAGDHSPGAATAELTPFQPRPFEPVTELKIQDIKVGTGTEATPGKKVTVDYTGWLSNGQKFDSSKDRGQPFSFNLGSHQVIQGWDQGVAGMKVGGIRRLTIPSQLAYGERGAPGAIPMNASLQFDVELLNVE